MCVALWRLQGCILKADPSWREHPGRPDVHVKREHATCVQVVGKHRWRQQACEVNSQSNAVRKGRGDLFREEAVFCGPHTSVKLMVWISLKLVWRWKGPWGVGEVRGLRLKSYKGLFLYNFLSFPWLTFFLSLIIFRYQCHSCFPNPEEERAQRTLGKNWGCGVERLCVCTIITAVGRERLPAAEGWEENLGFSVCGVGNWWDHRAWPSGHMGVSRSSAPVWNWGPALEWNRMGTNVNVLPCVRLCALAHSISFGPHGNSAKQCYHLHFQWGSENVCHLRRLVQLVRGRAGIWVHACVSRDLFVTASPPLMCLQVTWESC